MDDEPPLGHCFSVAASYFNHPSSVVKKRDSRESTPQRKSPKKTTANRQITVVETTSDRLGHETRFISSCTSRTNWPGPPRRLADPCVRCAGWEARSGSFSGPD